MTQDLKRSIIQIRDTVGTICGTGFIINNNVAVTCAHVVKAVGAAPGDSITVVFSHTGETCSSLVLPDPWRSSDEDDIAILRLPVTLPAGVIPLKLGSSKNTGNHTFNAFGYPQLGDIRGVWAQGTILGPITNSRGTTMLQIRAQEIVEGMSGAPVLDTHGDRVIGMVTATYYHPNSNFKLRDVAFATPVEVIAKAFPGVTLVPPNLPVANPDSTIHTLRSAINQAPPIPRHFVPRPEITDALKLQLTGTDLQQPGMPDVGALLGLGGIGKSTIAASLAYDSDIQERFSDGILWATLGQQPDILFTLSHWIQTLGDFDFRATSVKAATKHLRNLLSHKSALLILDDVWDAIHIRPFEACGSHGHMLITTRRFDVAEEVGAKIYQMEVMSPVQTLNLLSARMNRPISDDERNDALRLAEAVGFLPLALELAAARVVRGTTWTMLRQALEEEVAQLEALETPRRRRRERSQVEASFNLSLKALENDDEETRQAFIWLGVLPGDVQVTAPMVATLWQMDIEKAVDALELLWNDALLLPGPPIWIDEKQWPSYRLHDLLRDIARRLFTSPRPAGLGLSLPEVHTTLLERYKQKTQNGLWHTLPNDGYIHVYLSWHMQQAGQPDQLHALLNEETASGNNGWYHAREQLGQTSGFLADVNLALITAQENSANKLSQSTSISLQIRYVLMIASLNSLARNLPLPLLIALVEKQMWTPAQGLAYARQMLNLDQQVKAIIELSTHMASGVKDTTLTKALNIAQSINTPWEQTETLLWVVQRLAELNNPAHALAAVELIKNEHWQTEALTKLISHLPEDMLQQALDIAEAIDEEEYRIEVIAQLVPYLPHETRAEFLQKVLVAAQNVTDENQLTELLAGLAPHLSETLLSQALTIARDIEWEGARAEALAELAPYLPSTEKDEALKDAVSITKTIRIDEQRSQILLKLAPHLPEKLLAKAVATAWVIKSRKTRVKTLIRLAPYLQEEFKQKATDGVFTLIRETEGNSNRAALAAGLAPYLEEPPKTEILTEVLNSIREIQNEWKRAEILANLIPHLPEGLLVKALLLAQDIQNEEGRYSTLTSLTHRLAEYNHLDEALTAARAINNKWHRVKALTKVAPHLADEQKKMALQEALEISLSIDNKIEQTAALAGIAPPSAKLGYPAQAITAIRGIWDDKWQTRALTETAPYLPDIQLAEALSIAQSIKGTNRRTEALVGLAPYLPESLLIKALRSAHTIYDEQQRSEALLMLVPHLPQEAKQKAMRGLFVAVRAVWDKPKQLQVLTDLAPHFPESQRAQLLQEIDDIGWDGQDERAQTTALIKLGPYLSEPLQAKALAIVKNLGNESNKTEILINIVPHLSTAHLTETLTIVQSFQNELAQNKALAGIAPYLPQQLIENALESVQNMQSELHRADVLAKLCPHLPEHELSKTLRLVHEIKDEWRQADALVALSVRFAQFNHYHKAIAIARIVWDDVKRAIVLARILSYLPRVAKSQVLQEAMSAYRSVWYIKWRAEVLAELSPHLPTTIREDLFGELLATIASVTNERKRVEAASKIIPILPEQMLAEGLKIIQGLQKRQQQTDLLLQIIPHLSEPLLIKTHSTAQTMPELKQKAILLAELALYLPDDNPTEILKEALTATWAVGNRDHLEETLAQTIPRFRQLPRAYLSPLWQEMLTYLAQRRRKNLLADLFTLEPIISALGGVGCMGEVSQAIKDIGRWWP